MSRGDRGAFAASVARRHGLPSALAYQIADNRLSVHEAVQQHAAAARLQAQERRRRTGVRAIQVLVVLGLAATAVGAMTTLVCRERGFTSATRVAVAPGRADAVRDLLPAGRTRGAGPLIAAPAIEPPLPPRLTTAEVHRDGAERVIEVVAGDPISVLETYCRSSGDASFLAPLGITETVPPLAHARHGVFEDTRTPGSSLAIWMRLDHRTRRWIAGDGKGPIPVDAAPMVPARAPREPLPGTTQVQAPSSLPSPTPAPAVAGAFSLAVSD